MEDSRIKLVPFTISEHAKTVFDNTRDDPQAYAHLSFGPFDSVEGYEKLVKTFVEEDETALVLAILLQNTDGEKDKEGEMVGTMGYFCANAEERSIEISLVQIFPKYRRQGFAVDAGRLLIDYALTPVAEGGLGLVRVEWNAATTNLESIAVAKRLGFEEIGVIRYEKFLKDGRDRGKVGNGRSKVPPGTGPGDLWRDLIVLAAYWDGYTGVY